MLVICRLLIPNSIFVQNGFLNPFLWGIGKKLEIGRKVSKLAVFQLKFGRKLGNKSGHPAVECFANELKTLNSDIV